MTPKRISIIYTKAGGGHISLAEAARESLTDYFPHKFTLDLHDPLDGAFTSPGYELLTTKFSDIYKAYWHTTNKNPKLDLTKNLSYLAIVKKFSRYLKSFQPDLIILNNGFLCPAVSQCLQDLRLPTKLVVHIPDPINPHQNNFTQTNVDLYLSPTPEATQVAIAAGVSPSLIKTVGWTTRKTFYSQPLASRYVRQALGLDKNTFTIFIGGSGQSHPTTLTTAKLLLSHPDIKSRCQIILNTGFSDHMTKEAIRLCLNHQNCIVLPYIRNLPDILSASDLVIGKAGPNFMFECFALTKPLMAICSYPGQEEGNLEFITSHNLGWVETVPHQAASQVHYLLTNPKALHEKTVHLQKIAALHKLARRHFAFEINSLLTKTQPSKNPMPYSPRNLRHYLFRLATSNLFI